MSLVILRYFAYVLAAAVALALGTYLVFGILVGTGAVYPANYGDTALAETSARLAELPSDDAGAIDDAVPSSFRWALFAQDGAYVAGDAPERARDDLKAAAFDGLAIAYGGLSTTRYEPVELADGSGCVLTYDYMPQFASKGLRDALPNPQNLLLGGFAVLAVLVLVSIAVRAARVLLTWDRSPEYYSQSDWKGTWDKEGGGVIIDQAIHTLDLMRWFIGRPVTGVQASLANRTHPDIPVEDTAEGRVEFEGGAYGAFYVMNHYCTDEPVRLELACTRGKAVMEGPKARVELNNGLTCLADNDPTQMFEYGDVKQYWGTSHVKQIGNFYQSLLGLAPMYVTAENAFLTQEMICALYEHGRRHFVREVR
mgnify:CR=1 FL=1